MTPPIERKLLPDGTLRVRIHFFVRDQSGGVNFPGGVILRSVGGVPMPLRYHGSRGYFACAPDEGAAHPVKDGRICVREHTGDPRAVTCPECVATDVFKAKLRELEEAIAKQPLSRVTAPEGLAAAAQEQGV